MHTDAHGVPTIAPLIRKPLRQRSLARRTEKAQLPSCCGTRKPHCNCVVCPTSWRKIRLAHPAAGVICDEVHLRNAARPTSTGFRPPRCQSPAVTATPLRGEGFDQHASGPMYCDHLDCTSL